MSDANSFPPPVPPQISLQPGGALSLPLGQIPEERVPVSGFSGAVESILRQPRRIIYQLFQPGQGSLIAKLLLIALVCSLVYGLVVGTFSKGDQLWAAPVKIAAGLLISALICLPSLYIFTCLSGSHARLPEIFGLMCGLLLLMTMLLIGFAPVAWLFSESTNSITWMGVLHL